MVVLDILVVENLLKTPTISVIYCETQNHFGKVSSILNCFFGFFSVIIDCPVLDYPWVIKKLYPLTSRLKQGLLGLHLPLFLASGISWHWNTKDCLAISVFQFLNLKGML